MILTFSLISLKMFPLKGTFFEVFTDNTSQGFHALSENRVCNCSPKSLKNLLLKSNSAPHILTCNTVSLLTSWSLTVRKGEDHRIVSKLRMPSAFTKIMTKIELCWMLSNMLADFFLLPFSMIVACTIRCLSFSKEVSLHLFCIGSSKASSCTGLTYLCVFKFKSWNTV